MAPTTKAKRLRVRCETHRNRKGQRWCARKCFMADEGQRQKRNATQCLLFATL